MKAQQAHTNSPPLLKYAKVVTWSRRTAALQNHGDTPGAKYMLRSTHVEDLGPKANASTTQQCCNLAQLLTARDTSLEATAIVIDTTYSAQPIQSMLYATAMFASALMQQFWCVDDLS
jgi:hypothetical protein